MEWLSQNWTWILLIAAVVWMFWRSRHGGFMGGCCGMAHEGPQKTSKGAGEPTLPAKEAVNQDPKDAAPSHHRHGGCH